MGYVGFSVAFSFAIAHCSAQAGRTWHVGRVPGRQSHGVHDDRIALGSEWAYYVLGWGGWWFWDHGRKRIVHALAGGY